MEIKYVYFINFLSVIYLPQHNPNKCRSTWMFDMASFHFLMNVTSLGLGLGLAYHIFPRLPILPGYDFSDETVLLTYVSIIPFMVIELLICVNTTFVMVFIFMIGCLLLPFVAHELRLGRRSYKSQRFLRANFEELSLCYKSVEILQKLCNDLLGIFIFPCQTFITVTFCLCWWIFISNRMDGLLNKFTIYVSVAGSVIITVSWSIVLILGGHLHLHGNKVIKSWRYNNATYGTGEQRKLITRLQKTSRPISFSWGTTFIIQKRTFLLFMRGLTRGLIRTLLAFK